MNLGVLREVTETRTLRPDASETCWELRSCTTLDTEVFVPLSLVGDTVEGTDLPMERCTPRPQGGSDDLVLRQMGS